MFALALVLGLLLVGYAVVAWSANKTAPKDFGTRAASGISPAPTALSVPITAAPSPPSALVLSTLNVRAPVQDVAVTDGVMGVPKNPAEVGWFSSSAPIGAAAGATVIDGHVDSAVAGRGALYNLYKLQAGDPVAVVTSAGNAVNYRVYARQTYTKTQGLPDDLFAATGPPRLVLITCGGTFDSVSGHYESNVVVLASPVT